MGLSLGSAYVMARRKQYTINKQSKRNIITEIIAAIMNTSKTQGRWAVLGSEILGHRPAPPARPGSAARGRACCPRERFCEEEPGAR